MTNYPETPISRPKSEGGSSIFQYYLAVEVLGQSSLNNTSTVKLSLCMYCSSGTNKQWSTVESKAPTSSITVDGTVYSSDVNAGSSSGTYYIVNGKIRLYYRSPDPLVIATKTLTVTHDSQGAKTLSVSFNWIRGSGETVAYYPSSFSSTTYNSNSPFSVVLPTISRIGVVECNSAVLLDSTTSNFNYTFRAYVSGWYYRLRYALDGRSGYVWGYSGSVATSPVSKSAGTVALTISYSDLLDKIRSGVSKNLTITVDTFSDSAGSSLVGSYTKTVVVSVDTTVFRPSITAPTIGVNSSPISGKLIAGKSTANVSFTATPSTGTLASALSTTLILTNGTFSGTSPASGTKVVSGSGSTVATNVLPSSSANYILGVTGSTTDSRGVSNGNRVSGSNSVYGYAPPSIEADVIRVSQSGNRQPCG